MKLAFALLVLVSSGCMKAQPYVQPATPCTDAQVQSYHDQQIDEVYNIDRNSFEKVNNCALPQGL